MFSLKVDIALAIMVKKKVCEQGWKGCLGICSVEAGWFEVWYNTVALSAFSQDFRSNQVVAKFCFEFTWVSLDYIALNLPRHARDSCVIPCIQLTESPVDPKANCTYDFFDKDDLRRPLRCRGQKCGISAADNVIVPVLR